MYLSKLVLNESDRAVQRDLSDAHKLHQRIMQAFPDDLESDRPRQDLHILFRQEPDSNVVLVQSAIAPNWSILPSGYLQEHHQKEWQLDIDQCSSGRILQFRLRANPSKRDNQTRKTIGLFHEADQVAWLQRQAERCGFRLHGIDVIPSPNVFGIKKGGKAPIRITTALYQGVLEVVEPELFLNAVRQGIGRGKSYGCGLLSISRITI
ncbi:MAG TPA: type I-E CRISPR-associated protein Cas6/Cse3/CasE [Candidatus Obscuribacterales bacterium]